VDLHCAVTMAEFQGLLQVFERGQDSPQLAGVAAIFKELN
jgi:hypothetical protein